ncbi:hypothetical protein T4B_8764, partial [Trichinella pseudospiralis]
LIVGFRNGSGATRLRSDCGVKLIPRLSYEKGYSPLRSQASDSVANQSRTISINEKFRPENQSQRSMLFRHKFAMRSDPMKTRLSGNQ